MDDQNESTLVGREPCPKCGSSDNLARYSDGHGYCFSAGCAYFEPGNGELEGSRKAPPKVAAELIDGSYAQLPKRGLTEETARKFLYKQGSFKGKPCHLAGYTDKAGNLVAQKLRFGDKKEGMPWVGDKSDLALFGSHIYGKGKKIVITEGELDAMSVSQAQGNKWPAVSLINGASGARKDIANNLEYLSAFEEIVLMFDMDEAGRTAVEEAAEVLTGKKVFVASLPLKDASECLQAGRVSDIVSAIWNAKPYSPSSVTFGEEIIRRRRSRPAVTSYPFPDWLPAMNKKCLGIRLGELETWTSGSGMGKTTMIKQLQVHFFKTTQLNQAIIHLEEPLEDTADSLIGVYMERRLNLPEVAEVTPEADIHRAEEELFLAKDAEGNHRLYLHDAFGSMGSDENLMNRIRYYAHACNCKVIWLDHLSILVSDMGIEGDERRRIDQLMHNLKSLTIELGIYIGLISHLKKAGGSGPSFEEGAVPSLDDLRGSGGIKQLSNSVFALSRNQQAETEAERNTSQTHVLKCRYTGNTGPADYIFFDALSGVFTKTSPPTEDGRFTDMSDEFSNSKPSGGFDPRDDIPF